ncbi:hypothetical protein ACQGRJ_10940 [Bacillus atrophaeus]|uniref:hypothetical protein n=1 Tax=Bacillus atrophaeus TaxID=1452 RepID=UPI003CF16C74
MFCKHKHDFEKQKKIGKYLTCRYGRVYLESIEEQKKFKKEVEADHTDEELKLMINRLDKSIEINKDSGYWNVVPYTIFCTLVTAIATVLRDKIETRFLIVLIILGYLWLIFMWLRSLYNHFNGFSKFYGFKLLLEEIFVEREQKKEKKYNKKNIKKNTKKRK